jgi:hypothetical protein
VSLVDEEVIGEIADVNGLDVLGVKALVDGTKPFQISFGKEILGITLLEKPQLGQAAPRESFSSSLFSPPSVSFPPACHVLGIFPSCPNLSVYKHLFKPRGSPGEKNWLNLHSFSGKFGTNFIQGRRPRKPYANRTPGWKRGFHP